MAVISEAASSGVSFQADRRAKVNLVYFIIIIYLFAVRHI